MTFSDAANAWPLTRTGVRTTPATNECRTLSRRSDKGATSTRIRELSGGHGRVARFLRIEAVLAHPFLQTGHPRP